MRAGLAAAIGLGLAVLWPLAATAQPKDAAANAAGPRPAQIDRNGVLILIRSALIALHQGNETGNYTVLRDLSAPGFRDANTAARLAEIFASQRAQKLDLSGVAVLEPQLTLLPQIETGGLLHMSGFFPSVPSQVNFELLFAPVDGRWRLFGLSVDIGSSTPTAPTPPPAPPSPQKGDGKSEAKTEPKRPPAPRTSPKAAAPAEQPPPDAASGRP